MPYAEKPKLDEQTFSWSTNDQVVQLLEVAAAARSMVSGMGSVYARGNREFRLSSPAGISRDPFR